MKHTVLSIFHQFLNYNLRVFSSLGECPHSRKTRSHLRGKHLPIVRIGRIIIEFFDDFDISWSSSGNTNSPESTESSGKDGENNEQTNKSFESSNGKKVWTSYVH